MRAVSTNDATAVRRRLPVQDRSRERVGRILDAASEIVVAGGVEALTTRAIATRAQVPVASLYQYFSDKEAVLLALIERDMAEMDEQVAQDLGALTSYDVASVVETTMRAFVKVYHRRPAFVEIWLRGRINATIRDAGRAHNRRVAGDLWAFVTDLGMVREGTRPEVALLAVEIGDRVFQLAFETSRTGDAFLIEQGIAMITAYLRQHARAVTRS